MNMFRFGIVAGLSFFLIAAIPVPAPNPVRELEITVAQDLATNVEIPKAPEAVPLPQIGNDTSHPIFAKVSCEHGCGYSEDNEGWLQKLWTDPVATFTAALAVLTFGLVIAGMGQGYLILRSEKLTRAALLDSQKATKAAIALELPVIRALSQQLLTVDQFPVGVSPYGATECYGIPSSRSVVHKIGLLNVGRTNASPIAISIGWYVGQELPEKPNYVQRTHSAKHAWLLKPNTPVDGGIDPLCIELTEQQIEGLKSKDDFLWLYARIEYEDFMDTVREVSFCWLWTQSNSSEVYYFDPARDVPSDYTFKTSVDFTH